MVDSSYGRSSFNYPQNPLSGEEWSIVDRFDSSYWSGREVVYYFDNVRLDEVIQLSYQVVERATPFYGYASYVADVIVHGQRLISGEITMNFKRDGYIFSLLNLLRSEDPGSIWANLGQASDQTGKKTDWGNNTSPSAAAASLKSGSLSPAQLKKVVQERYQQEIGSGSASNYPSVVETAGGLYATRKKGFDINIIFGADLRSELALRYDGNSGAYADIIRVPSEQVTDNIATGVKIIGASISGKGRTISDDGRPVAETFTFTARDLVILNPEDIDSQSISP